MKFLNLIEIKKDVKAQMFNPVKKIKSNIKIKISIINRA